MEKRSSNDILPYLVSEAVQCEGLAKLLNTPSQLSEIQDQLVSSVLNESFLVKQAETWDKAAAVEAAYEGFLLHHRTAENRVFKTIPERDLAILAGDFFYALSLQLLASPEITGQVHTSEIAVLAQIIQTTAELAAADISNELLRMAWQIGSLAVQGESREETIQALDLIKNNRLEGEFAVRYCYEQSISGANL